MYSEGVPLIGDILAFMQNPLELARWGRAVCAGVLTVHIARKQMTFLLGAAPHAVFSHVTDEELDQTELHRSFVTIVCMFSAHEAVLPFRQHQVLLLPLSLRDSKLETYVPIMVAKCVAFSDAWADEGEVELFESLSQLIILTPAGASCSRRFGTTNNALRAAGAAAEGARRDCRSERVAPCGLVAVATSTVGALGVVARLIIRGVVGRLLFSLFVQEPRCR